MKEIAVIGAATVAALSATAQVADRPVNVVFILTDDMGIGDVGVYGGRLIKTPNIDALAAGAQSTIGQGQGTGLHFGHLFGHLLQNELKYGAIALFFWTAAIYFKRNCT